MDWQDHGMAQFPGARRSTAARTAAANAEAGPRQLQGLGLDVDAHVVAHPAVQRGGTRHNGWQ